MSTSNPPAAPSAPTSLRTYARWDPRRATMRVVIAALVGTLAAFALPHSFRLAERVVAGWDVAAGIVLSLCWAIIWRSDAHDTHCRAASVDPGRTAVWALVVVSGLLSLFAATVVLHLARNLAPRAAGPLVALCLTAVVCAWSVTHTSYTLRYAHLYYRDDNEGVGGLEFPGHRPPDYVDFAYFAFTIGMTFQVSDVTITSQTIRRTVLGHALLAFAYNTAILALALNLISGLLG